MPRRDRVLGVQFGAHFEQRREEWSFIGRALFPWKMSAGF
jgi:hypothetical protein